MSIFPALSVTSSDNRVHLQALRHFYALATHQRIIDQIDVRSNKYLECPIKIGESKPDRQITYKDTTQNFVFERYLQRSFEGRFCCKDFDLRRSPLMHILLQVFQV